MFEPAEQQLPDILAPRRRLGVVGDSSEPHADPGQTAQDRKEPGPNGLTGGGTSEVRRSAGGELLERLAAYIQSRLPWVSRTDTEPVGMWVEDVGFVSTRFEPQPIGTPYVWIGVTSWEAAEAVYEALHAEARIDDAVWIGGWFSSERGFRRIKIYPELPETLAAD